MNHNDWVPLEAVEGLSRKDRYWRTLEELEAQSQSAGGSEPNRPLSDGRRSDPNRDRQGAVTSEEPDRPPDEQSRRRFLQLAGASLALAGTAACTRQPPEFIYPYVEPPEHAIPGKPIYFATAAPMNGVAEGVVVETHLGRPTKVEGNPAHPGSLGATSVHSQASVLNLYDPDRAREIRYREEPHTWAEFSAALSTALQPIQARKGAGLRLLTETVVSPTLAAQVKALLTALPEAQWHQYDPCGPHSARQAAQLAFGRPVHTYYRLDRADVVVALDSDFLATETGSTRYARDFIKRRTRGDRTDMNRLYAAESTLSATGGKADHRLPLRYSEVEAVALELAAAVGAPGVPAPPAGNHTGWVSAVALDLMAHRGASAIVPGEYQSPAVHLLAHILNRALGNTGQTVIHTASLEAQPVDQIDSLRQLIHDMDAGAVDLLLIFGGNPVYNAPVDLGFRDQLQRVKLRVRLGLHRDETSNLCQWHIPEPHFFEDWGDVRAYDGTVSIVQPLIEPLYDSHSAIEIIDAIVQFPGRKSYDIVRGYWQGQHHGADFEDWWRKSVHDGYIQDSALREEMPAIQPDWGRSLTTAPATSDDEIVFRPDPYVYDGRFANNTWLQELPRPITKLTWDNAVLVSPAMAQRMNMERQHVVELRYRGRALQGPIWIVPGHPDGTVTVHLGYGRTEVGRAADNAGFNAYALRTSDALWSASGLSVKRTDEHHVLASTQLVQGMEGRNLVIANTVGGYKQSPDFVQRIQEPVARDFTLYPIWKYPGYTWGMSIDLTACVSCNACVVACQSENNIPVVGKEQVVERRAMHWIRIDTYFKGPADQPEVYYQPVPCMQCEDAPCELVCPVQATNHSRDGLNDMIYNRCVGTRYCSNNCPYKVRRFNFYLFQDWTTETLKFQRNPDVSVRSRGVMEKCTYCVQRIREAEIRANVEDRDVRTGEVQTACQQACPTGAIVFGDINNRQSPVSRLKALNLNYALLAELNTRPRTTYLAELRNPNPDLKESRS